MVGILKGIGRQVRAPGVPEEEQWATVGALLKYILGVGGQNTANRQLARNRSIDRSDFLEAVSTAWSQLDPDQYPSTRSIAAQLRGITTTVWIFLPGSISSSVGLS